jgi:hypothetical protein
MTMMTRANCHAAAVEIARNYIPSIGPGERRNDGLGWDHLLWMVDAMADPEMSDAKANRWLGYIQGAMVWSRCATLDEMKEINMRHAQ